MPPAGLFFLAQLISRCADLLGLPKRPANLRLHPIALQHACSLCNLSSDQSHEPFKSRHKTRRRWTLYFCAASFRRGWRRNSRSEEVGQSIRSLLEGLTRCVDLLAQYSIGMTEHNDVCQLPA